MLHPQSFPILRPSYGAALPALQGQNFCLDSCFIRVLDPLAWNKKIILRWPLVQWVQYREARWHSSRPSSMQRTHGHSRFSAQRQTCVFSFSPGGISCLLCHQQSRCIISYFSFVASLNPLANSLRDLFFCFFLTLKQSSKGKKKIISDKSNVRIHLILRFFFPM